MEFIEFDLDYALSTINFRVGHKKNKSKFQQELCDSTTRLIDSLHSSYIQKPDADVASTTSNVSRSEKNDWGQESYYSIVDIDLDYVVVGEGRTVTAEALETATRMILDGAKLVATNLDPNCPTASGTRPGCGAIVAFLETATGKKAFSVGKPSPVMMRAARKQLELATSQTVMIGDTMETDIMGAVQLGYHAVLVLSGGTQSSDLANFAYRPDLIVESVAELAAPSCDLWKSFGQRNTEEDSVPDIEQWRKMQLALQ